MKSFVRSMQIKAANAVVNAKVVIQRATFVSGVNCLVMFLNSVFHFFPRLHAHQHLVWEKTQFTHLRFLRCLWFHLKLMASEEAE